MSFKHAARHLSLRGRLAQRRMRQVLARTTLPYSLGPATGLFSGISAVAHAVLTWGIISVVPTPLPDAANDPLVASRFLYPLMQQRPQPQVEHISYVGLIGPRVPPVPAVPRTGSVGRATADTVVAAVEPPSSEPAAPFEAYSELEVDVAAQRAADSEGPSYPDSLLAREVEGEARVLFVIDSTGRAVEQTFTVLSSNHPGFSEAVRLALPRMRFKPATMGPKAVAQRVEQTFVFKITRPPIVP